MQQQNLPNDHFEMPTLKQWWHKQYWSEEKFKIISFAPFLAYVMMEFFGIFMTNVEELAIHNIREFIPWWIWAVLGLMFFAALVSGFDTSLPDYRIFMKEIQDIKEQNAIHGITYVEQHFSLSNYPPLLVGLIMLYFFGACSCIVLVPESGYPYLYSFAPVALIIIAIYAWYHDNRWHKLIHDIKQNGIDRYLQEVEQGKA